MIKKDLTVQTRQYQKVYDNEVISVSLSLATSEDIMEWSRGEVKKPETINYKSFKPEKEGLFDEVIFGPVTDYKCSICGTKYKRSNEGQFCEKSDECKIHKPEILPKSTRRSRMGHIKLASPVVHFWFFTINHSIISKVLGLIEEGQKKYHSRKQIENIIYFRSHIVLETGGIKALAKHAVIEINKAAVIYRQALLEIREKYKQGTDEYEEIDMTINDLEETASSKIGQDYGIDFYELNDVIETYSDAKISTGAKAIQYLLENFDIKKNISKVKKEIQKISLQLKDYKKSHISKLQQRAKLYKRLDVLNKFNSSKQSLTSMILHNLPVIPADLRPLIQIEGGRHSTSDINDLYRRIIIRNNRLKKWEESDAPILIIQNELRMLQEAVDALIDNNRKKPSPVMSKDNRPLKSISDSLSGKKGRFRQNLLGKRVDYSGRSVIIVGPNLKMHQVGIPRQMAAKLFEPWIINEIINAELVSSMKAAKKLVEEQDGKIWPFVQKAIEGKVVLLNRAPTLHRLSIQAFEPTLIRGKAIRLHALVTTAFNADFDGDQMAVHVPISPKAIREAKELMLANKNILGPKDGEPIINPSQDMVLGIYYLTQVKKGARGEGKYFYSYDEMIRAYQSKAVDLHARVAIPVAGLGKDSLIDQGAKGYVISTVGKFIFNKSFPTNFLFIFDANTVSQESNDKIFIAKPGTNIPEFIQNLPPSIALSKKHVAKIVRRVFDVYTAKIPKEDLAHIIKKINKNNYKNTVVDYKSLKDKDGESLGMIHANILSEITKTEFEKINKRITKLNENVMRVFEAEERVELLEAIWFHYTNIVAQVLDNIKDLGFKYSTQSGVTMSIDDIKLSPVKIEEVKKGEKYISKLKTIYEKGLVTDDERYKLVIQKWAEVKNVIQDDLKSLVTANKNNPIFMMMDSGARGNISNFVQLAGLRGLMSNSKKMRRGYVKNAVMIRHTIEVPVKSSFLEGLTAYEFYSSTHGARKGLTDTALNTSNSGYLTRRLVDVAQNIVVREDDCGSERSHFAKADIETKTGTVIVSLGERIAGRFTNNEIFDKKGELIIGYNQLISEDIAYKIEKEGIKVVEIRTVFGCNTRNGVCQKCYGKDLASNRLVEIGEPVGIVAAQSIGEPGTQLTMRTFHTGGVAGVQDITGGFARLMQLIDATKDVWEAKAVISEVHGTVTSIVKKDANVIITVTAKVGEREFVSPEISSGRRIRVKSGDIVKPGQKLVEGPIILNELLEVAGTGAVQRYILKEIQRLYRMQGITISDKYIEIIVRQFLSKISIIDAGDSSFFIGTLVDINNYRQENAKLLAAGKRPAYGDVVINGAKRVPLLSESFLAAASYQETPTVLVQAAIENKKDYLEGLKENLILGHKIPAGTGTKNFTKKGKFDIQDPRSFFK